LEGRKEPRIPRISGPLKRKRETWGKPGGRGFREENFSLWSTGGAAKRGTKAKKKGGRRSLRGRNESRKGRRRVKLRECEEKCFESGREKSPKGGGGFEKKVLVKPCSVEGVGKEYSWEKKTRRQGKTDTFLRSSRGEEQEGRFLPCS